MEILYLLATCLIQVCFGETMGSLKTINMTNYEKVSLPYIDEENKIVDVNVSMHILNIGNLNTKEMTFEVEMYFDMKWTDPRLAFKDYNNATYALMTGETAYENIWVPDLFIRNMKHTESSKFLKDLSGVTIYPNGVVRLSSRIRVVAHCEMDLLMFPLDSQSCNLMIESYIYHTAVMKTYWAENPVVIDDIRDGRKSKIHTWMGFSLVETLTTKDTYIYPTNGLEFQYMIATFVLKRQPQYYILRGFIPSCLLVFLTWASFWLPTSSFPARVTLVVTSFLASIVLYQGSTLHTQQMTVMQVFLFGNIAFILLTLLEFLLAVKVDDVAKNKNRKVKSFVNEWLKSADDAKTATEGREENLTRNKKEEIAIDLSEAIKKHTMVEDKTLNVVDKIARYLIPFVYLVYVAIFVGVIVFVLN